MIIVDWKPNFLPIHALRVFGKEVPEFHEIVEFDYYCPNERGLYRVKRYKVDIGRGGIRLEELSITPTPRSKVKEYFKNYKDLEVAVLNFINLIVYQVRHYTCPSCGSKLAKLPRKAKEFQCPNCNLYFSIAKEYIVIRNDKSVASYQIPKHNDKCDTFKANYLISGLSLLADLAKMGV